MAKIKSIVNPKADWIRVVNAARRTGGKAPIDHEPSNAFKRKILLAEHSPIRLLEYDITIEDIQQWITVHLVRHHEGCQFFVHSQRIDRNEDVKELADRMYELLKDASFNLNSTRDAVPQGLRNDMLLSANAQALMNISRKRLCKGCASKETRSVWELVIGMLGDIDPILAEKCVPECIYRGFCPEVDNCCGYVGTGQYEKRRLRYLNVSNEP